VRVGPHGVVIDGRPAVAAGAAARPRPAVGPSPDLFGRSAATDAVLDGITSGLPVEISGGCGVGKTALLAQVRHRATTEFRERPVVSVRAARKDVGDLVQEVHDQLYRTQPPEKVSGPAVRARLARTPAVVLLDDVGLPATDLAELCRVLQGCSIVVTSAIRRLDPDTSATVELDGLDDSAAYELLRHSVAPEELSADEAAAARQVCRLVGGYPLRLLQAAALVRTGRHTFSRLVTLIGQRDAAVVLARECRSLLSPEERQVVAVLAIAAGFVLPVELVKNVCAVTDVAAKLRGLQARRIVERRRDRYGLPVCSLGDPKRLVGPGLERALAVRHLVEWVEHPSTKPADLLEIGGGLLSLLELVGEAGDSEAVIRFVRAVEPALIVAGRWEQWHSMLETGLHAAEQMQSAAHRAYVLHQLGSRALCLGDLETARRCLEEAKRLRTRATDPAGRAATKHNLRLITPSRVGWRRAATIGAAAAAVVGLGTGLGLAFVPRGASPAGEDKPTTSASSSTSAPATGTARLLVTPGALRLPATQVGTASNEAHLTVTNRGRASLVLDGTRVGGAAAAEFSVRDDCRGTKLQPSGSCTIGVRFMPTAAGERTGRLTVAPEHGRTVVVALAGVGTPPPTGRPGATLDVNELSFRDTPVGSWSAPRSVRITSIGNAPLVVRGVTVRGRDSHEFAVEVGNCDGVQLARQQSCTVAVSFRPGQADDRTATLTVTTNASGPPFTVPLSGRGTRPQRSEPAISLGPKALTFADTPVGSPSGSSTVTVTNAGTASLVVDRIDVAGPQAGDFVAVDGCSSRVPPGGSCTIDVTFTPSGEGMRTASLTLTSNVTGPAVTLPLSGTATPPKAPAIEVSPDPVDFGVVTGSATKEVEISSTGTLPLEIRRITIGGDSPGNFTVTNDACSGTTLEPGRHCVVTVQISLAIDDGPKSATLTIEENVTDGGTVVPLKGREVMIG
jgi:hypothetical protein